MYKVLILNEGYRWHPSQKAKREFAQKMSEIDDFCDENGITQSASGDSYYFTINGQKYRISNHTVAASNRGVYNDYGEKKRDSYHPNGEEDDTIYITAGKTRIMDIYNNLKAGKKLDRRGNIIHESALIEATKSNNRDKNLWKSQMDSKDTEQLTSYLGKLYKQLADFNRNNQDIKSQGFYDLLDKIEYVESKLGIKQKIGRILH